MKRINIFLFIVLALICACTKSNQSMSIPASNDSLVVGMIITSPHMPVNEYLITNSALYEAANIQNIENPLVFDSMLPKNNFILASPLLSNFPQYLDNDTGGNLSTLGPVGIGIVRLQYSRNSHTIIWSIPIDTFYLPVPIRSYIYQVETTLYQL